MMKSIYLLTLFFVASVSSALANPDPVEIDTLIFKDLNSDGYEDTVFVFIPPHEEMGCKDTVCLTRVTTSFTEYGFSFENALGLDHIWDAGDLDGDGYHELAMVPGWFTSCWSNIKVYSYHSGEWIKIGAAPVYKCEEDLTHRIKKLNEDQFAIIGEVFDPEDWKKDSTYIFSLMAE